MDYWMVRACVLGYSEKLMDQKALSVEAGYWVAYYTNSKHPKKPTDIMRKMLEPPKKVPTKLKAQDLDRFFEREQRRKAYEASQVR